MDLKGHIKYQLDGSRRGVTRALNTLTDKEMGWRPAAGCNSMGLIFFHVIRSEDSFVQGSLKGEAQIWEKEKWHDRLSKGEKETGSHYSIDEVNEFDVPDMDKMLAYYEDVRQSTLDYLDSLPDDEFDRKVTLPFGDFTVAGIFSIIVTHAVQHTGEISYLRGMLRGMDK